ncbi:MAG: hypothetical protein J6D47_07710 [Peptostreptococcaceae bacterium]|nr:hypothetical protein [Peptostreptococcaceae bacterium]
MDSIVLSKELMELVEVHQVEIEDIVALNSVFSEVDVISIVENGCYYKYTGEGLNPGVNAFTSYCEDI